MNTFYFGIFVVSGVGNRALIIDPANNSVLVDAAVADLNVSSAKTAKYAELKAKYGTFYSVGNEQEAVISLDLVDNLPISAVLMTGTLNSGTTYTQICMLVKRNGSSDQIINTYTYDAAKVDGSVPKANTYWRDSETAFILCNDANGAQQIVRLNVDGTSSVSAYTLDVENAGPHVIRTASGERLLFISKYDGDTSSWVGNLLRDSSGTWTPIATGAATYPVTRAQIQALLDTAGVTAISVTGRTGEDGDANTRLEFWDTDRGFIQVVTGGYLVQNVATSQTTDLSTTITERTGGTSLSGGPEWLYLDADLPAALGYWRNLVGVTETEIP